MRVRCGTTGRGTVAALMPVGPGTACNGGMGRRDGWWLTCFWDACHMGMAAKAANWCLHMLEVQGSTHEGRLMRAAS